MTADEAKALLKKHGTLTRAAAAAGMVRSTFTRLVGGSKRPVLGTASSKVIGRSIAEFRETYDKNTIVPRKIEAGIKRLGNRWLYEVEFSKEFGVSLRDLSMFRDRYSDNVVIVSDSRRVWVGKRDVSETLKEML
jgi:hypothetical protein